MSVTSCHVVCHVGGDIVCDYNRVNQRSGMKFTYRYNRYNRYNLVLDQLGPSHAGCCAQAVPGKTAAVAEAVSAETASDSVLGVLRRRLKLQ